MASETSAASASASASGAPADTLVAVTGASGYIAGHCIRQLLEKGYKVRGTVRSLSNETKVKHLQEDFPGLELFEADLLSEGSFDSCFAGCKYVLHTASPFQLSVEDPQRDLVDPALKGTLNVLNSAKKAGTVTRVIVTSSCAAVATNARPADDKVWTEDDWNTDATLHDGAYRYSKTLAERAAWDFVKDAPFDVVTINPSFVLGPPTSKRTDSTSVAFIVKLLSGALKDGAPPTGFGAVDVRDVARAHVEAMERPDASGRYICSSTEGKTPLDVANALREDASLAAFHSVLPTKLTSDDFFRQKYSHAKAERELGITFTDVSIAVRDMAHYAIDAGLVSPPSGK